MPEVVKKKVATKKAAPVSASLDPVAAPKISKKKNITKKATVIKTATPTIFNTDTVPKVSVKKIAADKKTQSKKRAPVRARKVVEEKGFVLPESVLNAKTPALIVVEKKSIWYTPLSIEHSVVSLASFTIIFASIMLVSFNSQAQMSASVSAVVKATPENTRVIEKSFWDKLDPYQQLSVASGASLGVLLLSAGGLLALQRKKKDHILPGQPA